ncbi:MAG: glycosyltransferase family 39 protein, partial [Candidatus Omnitrophica bacterium]|nr:glycosyltransferase family 39 protein [Candidatus Omnitrophota bacterium]
MKRYYCLALIAVVFGLYARTFTFDFTWLDDTKLIVSDQKFLADFRNIPGAFRRDVVAGNEGPGIFYRPLVTLSLMVDAHIGGARPLVYHVTNVALHALVTCLVFMVLTALRYPPFPSFILSLIFAVHPVNVQPAAWIPGRTEMLLALFVLAAFFALIRFMETHKPRYLLAHLFLFACALLSKETAVALMPAALVYVYGVRNEKIFSRGPVTLIGCWAVLLVSWYCARAVFLPHQIVYPLGNTFAGLFDNLSGLLLYWGKIFLPVTMSVLSVKQDMPLIYGATAAIVALIIFGITRPKRTAMAAFGLAWF